MTREEAIEFANRLKNNYTIDFDDMADFCDEAVKALEQEGYYKDLAQSYEKTIVKLNEAIAERQPCEDAVSRQAILSKIKKVCFSEDWLQFRVDNGSNGQRDFLINYIEKLPSVTPMPLSSEDCVSRQAVLERINDWWGITATSGEPTICDYIRELPSVTPTRKVGEWITNSDIPDRLICSCCDSQYNMYFWEQDNMHYCPNCGAEMESEE